jgi:hypothetical protein
MARKSHGRHPSCPKVSPAFPHPHCAYEALYLQTDSGTESEHGACGGNVGASASTPLGTMAAALSSHSMANRCISIIACPDQLGLLLTWPTSKTSMGGARHGCQLESRKWCMQTKV